LPSNEESIRRFIEKITEMKSEKHRFVIVVVEE